MTSRLSAMALVGLMMCGQSATTKESPKVKVTVVYHNNGTSTLTASCPKGMHPQDTKHLAHEGMTFEESVAVLKSMDCVKGTK